MVNLDWPAIAVGTQAANTLAWLVSSWHFMPATARVMTKRGTAWDAAGAWACALGIVMVGYMLRWLAAGHAAVVATPLLPWWVVCNIGSTGVAAGITMTFRVNEMNSLQTRTRSAIYMWAAVTLACILTAAIAG